MCVSLLSVLIVLKLYFFSFLHCVLVYLFAFLLSSGAYSEGAKGPPIVD